ncbi:HU family DNA-binding protein [Parabacteroides sp.]
MNKADLVNELAVRMNVPQYQSRKFLEAFQDIIKETLKEDTVVLQGFGSFAPWPQAERMGRNPRTGTSCVIPSRISVKFKPGKFLLDELNS